MKKILTIALAFAVQMSAVNVMADTVVSYDRDTSVVSIKGSTEGKNKRVTVEILKPGVKSESLKDVEADSIQDYIYTVRQVVSDDEGNFETEFKMEEATADYTVRIKGDTTEEIELKYVNSNEYKSALAAINASDATTEDILKILEDNSSSLGLSQKYFSKLSANDKLEVAEEVLLARNELDSDIFTDYKELDKAYNTAVVIRSINSLDKNKIDATEILDEYADVFGLETIKVWELYEKLDDSQKKNIVTKMSKGKEIKSVQDLKDSFVEYTVLNEIQNADTYSDIYDLINDNNDILKINLTNYNKLSEVNKALVMQKIVGQKYESSTELEEMILKGVESVKKSSENGGGGGGGSGAGGSKGSKDTSTAVTVAVSKPTVQEEESIPFSDLENYEWVKDSILSLYEKGIVSGKGDGKYYPSEFVKREEFVKMLVMGIGLNQTENSTAFSDVDENMWYAPYIYTASETGIVKGVGDNIFGVGKAVTRQDIAVLLNRAATYLNIELPKYKEVVFGDEKSISSYAYDSVIALAEAGIINGNGSGEFAPLKSATRAETARLIAEFLKFTK